jgi:hypothetical protein
VTLNARLLFAAALASTLAGCNFDTSYHLLSSGDAVRVLDGSHAPDGWTATGFDDSSWPTAGSTVGPMAPCLARARFDLGPAYAAYHELTLTLGGGQFTAWVNGAQLTGALSGSTMTLEVPPGLLQPTGNVLAISYTHSPPTEAFTLAPQLDGQPDLAGTGPVVTKGPFLVRPTTTSVRIVWETSRAVASQAVVDGRVIDGGETTHHEAQVDGLSPSHAYPYHLELAGTRTPEAQLTTAPLPGENIRFVVMGDTRTNGDTHRRIVDAIEAEGPDFLVNTGDMVGESQESEWETFFAIEYPLLVHMPFIPAIGNHEVDYGDAAFFQRIFPVGTLDRNSGHTYSVDYGDVHVAVLDSNGGLGGQARWLDQDLTDATTRGARHLFVAMHWGPYSSGSTLNHGSNDDAQHLIVPVAKAHNVEAIFAGHDHFYERGASDNLTYFVTGGGGAPLVSTGRIKETLVAKSINHYLLIDVAGGQVHVSTKDLTGNTIDEVSFSR